MWYVMSQQYGFFLTELRRVQVMRYTAATTLSFFLLIIAAGDQSEYIIVLLTLYRAWVSNIIL